MGTSAPVTYQVETKEHPTGKYVAMVVVLDGDLWFSKLLTKELSWVPDLLTHAYNKGVRDGIEAGSRKNL